MINREDIKKLIEAHGAEETLDICFEECGELIQAISKAKRRQRAGRTIDHYNLLGEIADVLICVELLKEFFDIDDFAVEAIVKEKMKRNLKRIEG